MAVTRTTTESWGSRLGNSLKGILIGIVLVLGSIPVLFWNEGRAVKTAQALDEGLENVQSVADNSKVDPAMDGKLVHMTGSAVTQDVLQDARFGISHNGIRLVRNVEYYQWVEDSHTTEEKNVGGSVTKTTTYTYSQEWVKSPVKSGNFKEAGHDNFVCVAGLDDETSEWYAETVAFGAFKLNKDQISRVDNTQPYPLASYTIPQELAGRAMVNGDELYITTPGRIHAAQPVVVPQAAPQAVAPAPEAPKPIKYDSQTGQPIYGYDEQTGEPIYTAPQAAAPAPEAPKPIKYDSQTGQPIYGYDEQTGEPIYTAPQAAAPAQPVVQQPVAQPAPAVSVTPQVGDVRITWTVVSPKEDVSLVAVQLKDTFAPYTADSGYKVDLFSCGTKTAGEMFQDAQDANTLITWGIRVGGWFLMFIGFGLILRPISVVADVLPFLGNIAEIGLGVVSFLLSAVISLVVIAVAWIFYRPILGICLLAAGIGLIVWYISRKKAKAAAQTHEGQFID